MLDYNTLLSRAVRSHVAFSVWGRPDREVAPNWGVSRKLEKGSGAMGKCLKRKGPKRLRSRDEFVLMRG